MRRRRLTTALVAGLTALVVGACGGGGDDTTGSTTPEPSREPVAGGTATILTMSDPRSLDPAVLSNAYALTAVVGNALYGHLFLTDDKGELVGSMAESFETTDGGTTFTLTLREGLTFSDGTPLTAEDVKYNWDRIKDPAVGSSYRADAMNIASTEVVDQRTLKVTLTSQIPRFGSTVATTSLNWIGSKAALEQGAEAFDAKPIGAGPFTLSKWTRGADLELVKNPSYFDAPKPYLDGINIRPATDASQRYNTVLTGGAQVAVDSNWGNVAKAEEAGLPTNIMTMNGGLYLALNNSRAPFDDPRARQAVAAALDLDAFNVAVYNGDGEVPTTLFTKDSPFYGDTPLATHDPELAQRLFDELAAEGKPVKFTFSAFPTTENKLIAENVQAQLAAFDNVSVEVRTVDFGEIANLRATKDYDVIVSSAAFVDPEPQLWTVFHGSSPANNAVFDNAELNEALLAGRLGTTTEDRKAAYDKVQKILAEETPVIFVTRVVAAAIGAEGTSGLQQYGFGSLLPEEIWLDR
ncbi:MAG: ABC transporter substrate-binding protein [Frankia sp.]|nr:ABC transporter substrate-binding protein [Frankia sp.]